MGPDMMASSDRYYRVNYSQRIYMTLRVQP